MPEDERLPYHGVADATPVEVVKVGAANPSDGYCDLDLARIQRLRLDLFDPNVVGAPGDDRTHQTTDPTPTPTSTSTSTRMLTPTPRASVATQSVCTPARRRAKPARI